MKKISLISIIVVVLLAASHLLLQAPWDSTARDSGPKSDATGLARPASADVNITLGDKAGIAAHVKFDRQVALEDIEIRFKFLEDPADSTEYLDGAVSVEDQIELPRVLVTNDGWLIAYFLKDHELYNAWPYSNDVRPDDGILNRALNQVANWIGEDIRTQEVMYFNYEFPDADRLMVAVGERTDSIFTVHIPQGVVVMDAAMSAREIAGGDNIAGGAGGPINQSALDKALAGGSDTWWGSAILVYKEPEG